MLNVINLTKSFGKQIVLKNVNFNAQKAQLTILEGKNGAGKSTLFNILMGSIKLDNGNIILNNTNITNMPQEQRALIMAILKQDPKASSAPSLSVIENLVLFNLKNHNASLKTAIRPLIKEHIIAHLDYLNISFASSYLDEPVGNLSGGQRQILAFAMATLIKPQLLLLDEPTAALDESSTYLLMDLMKKLIVLWDIPAIMISHDHELNNSYADTIIKLKGGLICNL